MKYFIAVVCFISTLLCLEASKSGSGTWADRERLRKALFEDYDKMNLPENVTFNFGMSLINFDINTDNTMDVNGWFRYVWNDARLQWDEKEYNVGVIRVGSDEVWKPDMVLYNSAYLENLTPCGKTNALIYPNGQVLWVPPCTYRALCDMTDLKENPKKTFQCELKFGSWTYDGFSMDLQFYNNISSVDMTDFKDLSEWKITGSNGERVSKYYDCCAEPYISISYKFDIQKKSYNGKCSS